MLLDTVQQAETEKIEGSLWKVKTARRKDVIALVNYLSDLSENNNTRLRLASTAYSADDTMLIINNEEA